MSTEGGVKSRTLPPILKQHFQGINLGVYRELIFKNLLLIQFLTNLNFLKNGSKLFPYESVLSPQQPIPPYCGFANDLEAEFSKSTASTRSFTAKFLPILYKDKVDSLKTSKLAIFLTYDTRF